MTTFNTPRPAGATPQMWIDARIAAQLTRLSSRIGTLPTATIDALYRNYYERLYRVHRSRAMRVSAGRPPEPLTINWRGRRLASSMYFSAPKAYLRAREVFRCPDFQAAVKAGIEGDWRELAEYCEGSFTSYDNIGPLSDAVDRLSVGEVVLGDCGHWHLQEDSTTTEGRGRTYCQECAEEDLIYIEQGRLSGYYHRDDLYHWDSDGEYHLDPEPQEDEDEDNDDNLSSWGASTSCLNHDTSFTPSQWGDFTMGVELEVEATDSRYEAVQECVEHFAHGKRHRYAMFKEDGSLSSRGFEIVTAARKLSDHIAMFGSWEPSGMRAWSAGNCGMHVHVDSRAFTALTLGKFLMLFNDERNAAFIKAIAGRHPDSDGQAQRYAARNGSASTPAVAKLGAGSSRYRMVNLTNLQHHEMDRLRCNVDRDSKGSYSTVEVRIFRATLKKDRLLAQIEFTHAAVAFCRVASWHNLNGDAFKAWLGTTAGYPHLAKWFGVPVQRGTRKLVSKEAAAPATAES